ncbi:MAG: choice-of-anchor P family protein [Thermoplasmatota archaeon]
MTTSILLLTVLAAGVPTAHAWVESVCDTNVDVMLVLDRSGSMGGGGLTAAKSASSTFLGLLDMSDHSGLASYNQGASLDKGLDSMHTGAGSTDAAVQALGAGGSTGTGLGVQVAHQEFLANGRVGVPHVMIVLTDGVTNTGPNAGAAADAARLDGIRIFAIGLGNGINIAELNAIADNPDADHVYLAPTAADLEDIYLEILGVVNSMTHVAADAVPVRSELNAPLPVTVEVAPAEAGPGIDDEEADVLQVNFGPPLNGWVKVIHDDALTEYDPTQVHAKGRARIVEVNLFGGYIQADVLHAVAEAWTDGTTATTSDQGTTFLDVTVGTVTLSQSGALAPIVIPGVATVTFMNTQTWPAGATGAEILVELIRVDLYDVNLNGYVVIGQAYAGVSCDAPLVHEPVVDGPKPTGPNGLPPLPPVGCDVLNALGFGCPPVLPDPPADPTDPLDPLDPLCDSLAIGQELCDLFAIELPL